MNLRSSPCRMATQTKRKSTMHQLEANGSGLRHNLKWPTNKQCLLKSPNFYLVQPVTNITWQAVVCFIFSSDGCIVWSCSSLFRLKEPSFLHGLSTCNIAGHGGPLGKQVNFPASTNHSDNSQLNYLHHLSSSIVSYYYKVPVVYYYHKTTTRPPVPKATSSRPSFP